MIFLVHAMHLSSKFVLDLYKLDIFSAFQLLAVPGNTVEKIAMAMPEIFKDLHLNRQLCHKVFAEGMTIKNNSV